MTFVPAEEAQNSLWGLPGQTCLKREASSRCQGGDVQRIREALDRAGVEFIDENGGGPGVRLRKRQRARQSK